jgi:RecA-family ATPase
MLRPNGTTLFGITPKQALVLWVDTEQAPSHVQRVIRRIHRMASIAEDVPYDMLKVLTLREIEPNQRFDILRDAIAYYRPKLVVVDGISDLMYNSNCIEESDAVVGELMALSTEYNCHIMNVLHTNPNSDKARGHIGSTLQR